MWRCRRAVLNTASDSTFSAAPDGSHVSQQCWIRTLNTPDRTWANSMSSLTICQKVEGFYYIHWLYTFWITNTLKYIVDVKREDKVFVDLSLTCCMQAVILGFCSSVSCRSPRSKATRTNPCSVDQKSWGFVLRAWTTFHDAHMASTQRDSSHCTTCWRKYTYELNISLKAHQTPHQRNWSVKRQ